jgi:uncharacterized protein (TIGR03118 family)
MSSAPIRLSLIRWAMILPVTASLAIPAMAQHYLTTNLTADQSGVAPLTDTNLVNPWGLSRSAGSPWWVSDNGSGLSTLYDGTGAAKSLVVTIPTGDADMSATGSPTGTAFNSASPGFAIAPGKPAVFLFVTEDGTISGWNPGVSPTSAVITVNTKSESVFKGMTLGSMEVDGAAAWFMYVADFRKGRVAVYDTSFNHVHLGEDSFQDESIPNGFAPFNVQNIGGDLYVTYAKQDMAKHDPVAGAGFGYVDVFSPSGKLLRRFEHGAWLNGPWGLAVASGDFGIYSHDLLVGQFGGGNVAVYDPQTGRLKGMLEDATNAPIMIQGLWDLSFGSGVGSGPATTLFFTAGPDGETHGLFGSITPVENTLGNNQ